MGPSSRFPVLLRATRPRQWIKNVLLLAGLYFPDRDGGGPLLLDPQALGRAAAGFVIFCALSASIYLLNDVIDRPADRLHPKKKHRPIASGELSPAVALRTAAVLAALGLSGAFLLSAPSRAFFLCATAYFGMEVAYCLLLKEVFLIDTLIISLGFTVRAVSGIIVLRSPEQIVPLTPWFVICVLFLSLLLAFCKRRAELVDLEGGAAAHRLVLREYSQVLLDRGIAVCATAAILAYALYSVENDRPWRMLSTLPFVIFGVFRYLHLVYTDGKGGEPEEIFLGDAPLLGCIVLWGVALALVFYDVPFFPRW